MELAPAIAARAASSTGARDLDSLLGALIFLEAGGDERRLAKLMGTRSVASVVSRARDGGVGRVAAFSGDEFRQEVVDFPEGILAVGWQREIVGMLLRADGATTEEIEVALAPVGAWNTPMAITRLRIELKPFGVKIDSERFAGRLDFHYRIAGHSAWRMQKIIANGWSV